MRRRPDFGPTAGLIALCIGILIAGPGHSPASAQTRPTCDPDNGGITLPPGFCAVVVADGIGPARHLVVAPNGDIFIALRNRRGERGGVVALRDTTGDGRADVSIRFGENGGTGIALRDGYLYVAPDDAILRYPLPTGRLEPAGPPDTIVLGLPSDRGHAAKPIALGPGNAIFVNVGSPTNSCQEQDRQVGSRGQDPCPDLANRAGIWRFDADRLRQTQRDGERFATGLRNVVALTVHPVSGAVFGAQHGRDQLNNNWPALYDTVQSALLPSEEFVRIDRGDDFGWPYCYHDWQQGRKVLAPEYGGDGREAGRCTDKKGPLVAFPGHWAPNGLLFYTGTQFPAEFHGGAFVAFHGSWNRAPLAQEGYKVAYVPFRDGRPAGDYTIFANGFAGETVQPAEADHRPAGLAQGPDGSIYISDDVGGRIWRVFFTGAGRR